MKAPGGAILISLSLEGEGQACHEPELSEWFMGEGGYTRFRTDPVEHDGLSWYPIPKVGGVDQSRRPAARRPERGRRDPPRDRRADPLNPAHRRGRAAH